MRKYGIVMLACAGLLALSGSEAFAEKVRGTETCTAEKNERTINGKKYICGTKCTTPVTDTTCNPNCSTTVHNEVTYKDCEEKAAAISGGAKGAMQPKLPGALDRGERVPAKPGKVPQQYRTAPEVTK
jgi:hypothetical protein